MPKAPSPPRLRIGDAVSFLHRRHGLRHGYLLQPQGRGNYAHVLDYEGLVWRIPEDKLNATDRRRCRVLITPHDDARAGFALDDPVTFELRSTVRQGTIVKLNPKRAVVRCADGNWRVPYAALRSPAGSQPPEHGRRLRAAATLARGLMDAHGLESWTLAFVEARRRLGDCSYRHRLIRIARHHAIEHAEHDIRDTVLHEIAHALAGPEAHHGPVWKAVARRIGATPRAKAYDLAPAPPQPGGAGP